MVFIGITLLVVATILHIIYGVNVTRSPIERHEFFMSELNLLLTFTLSIILASVSVIIIWMDTNFIVAIILLGAYWMLPKYFVPIFNFKR